MIRGYIATSLDGYIASADGSLDWLRKYESVDFGPHGYAAFVAGIRTVVMGRSTYDEIRGYGVGWPYEGKRAIVVTSRPVDEPLGEIEVWSRGIDALATHLRALQDGNVWVVGGGQLQQALIERGALDRLEIFVVPELVGDGIRLFPPNDSGRGVTLAEPPLAYDGVVRLVYAFQT